MNLAKFMSICFYMAIGILTVYMSSHVGKKENLTAQARSLQKTYLAGIFLVLFVCSALRFDIGNDYRQYTQTAHEAFVDGYVVTECGFNYLVKLVYHLFGAEYYEIVFAIFGFATIWLFLKAMYEQSVDFSMTYFLFMTLGMYFQTFNTVRYYLALSIALYSMKYVLEKDYIRFILWIVFAALFHKSVLLVIPVYWIATYAWKKWQILVAAAISVACYCLKDVVLNLALILYPSYKNTIFLEGGTTITSILRILVIVAFYLVICIRYPQIKDDTKIRFYAQLNLLALDVSTCFSFLPVVTRIAYYFSVSQIVMIPAIICAIPAEKVKKNIRTIVIISCVMYFIFFLFTADKPGVGLLPYQTWLFKDTRYIYK